MEHSTPPKDRGNDRETQVFKIRDSKLLLRTMSLIVQVMYHLDISQLLRDVFVVHKDMVNVFWFVHN
jgi:hypothetical protein